MFRKNEGHNQTTMFSAVNSLPDNVKKRLESSWADAFYQYYFKKIDESVFAPLYSTKSSRPNVPVNVLIGFETLKAGLGLSDEAMYNSFLFDVQVRYALGLYDLDAGYFDLRTLYYFRAALNSYEQEHGSSLITLATQAVVKDQMETFRLKGGLQRMDSTLIQSNIRAMSRLQLVFTIIQRLIILASEEDIKGNPTLFEPYQKEDAQHLCYKIKYQDRTSRLEQAGIHLHQMLDLLYTRHGTNELWKQAMQVFTEHFTLVEKAVTINDPGSMSGSTMQSPHDPEATYRTKGHDSARGYVANLSETCDPSNEVQLITSTQVQPNTTDDQALLAEALPHLQQDMGLDTLLTDGGYAGPVSAKALDAHGVTLKTSAIKGAKRTRDAVGLEAFTQEKTADGHQIIRCMQGLTGRVKTGPNGTWTTVAFPEATCAGCPFQDQCPAKRVMKKDIRIVRFTKNSLRVAQTRKIVQEEGPQIRNQRASIESTVRSVIHVFGGHLCKLAVRGRQRVRDYIVYSAMMVNVRRLSKFVGENRRIAMVN